MRELKYGIHYGVCGVYKITNKYNGKSYIGSSVQVANRISNHMNRDARRYANKPFYKDVNLYGKEGFIFEVLEECSKDNLIEREQYWYDTLHPQYNIIRPNMCSFNDNLVRQLSRDASGNPEIIARRKMLYNTVEYKQLFRNIQTHRFKPVRMYNDNISLTFETMTDCAEWITNNTMFSGKNKVSKIKAVCDGERPSAYGYKFEYIKV